MAAVKGMSNPIWSSDTWKMLLQKLQDCDRPFLVPRPLGLLCCCLALTHPVFEGGWADGSLGTMITCIAKSRRL